MARDDDVPNNENIATKDSIHLRSNSDNTPKGGPAHESLSRYSSESDGVNVTTLSRSPSAHSSVGKKSSFKSYIRAHELWGKSDTLPTRSGSFKSYRASSTNNLSGKPETKLLLLCVRVHCCEFYHVRKSIEHICKVFMSGVYSE